MDDIEKKSDRDAIVRLLREHMRGREEGEKSGNSGLTQPKNIPVNFLKSANVTHVARK